ncbi:MAG: hypothetical protein WAQ08_16035 [Aquabacterium sp.]|uniref:hypothetical protein n=1 Tax=Aquabacterium sp. TaxID=1872578 RepID=UPI003BAED32C
MSQSNNLRHLPFGSMQQALDDAAPPWFKLGVPVERDPLDRLADEVAAMRDEIRALRAEQGLSTVIVTGREAVAAFQALSSSATPRR